MCLPLLKLPKQTTYFDYCIMACRSVTRQRPRNKQLYNYVRRQGLALSIWFNWVDSIWRRKQNLVSETLCVLNGNRTTNNVQKHNIYTEVQESQTFRSYLLFISILSSHLHLDLPCSNKILYFFSFPPWMLHTTSIYSPWFKHHNNQDRVQWQAFVLSTLSLQFLLPTCQL
jgi:hypothetical protein